MKKDTKINTDDVDMLESQSRGMKNSAKKSLRKYHLKIHYGLTQEDYNIFFDFQKGKCAICGKHQSEINKALFVDHNHETGKERGLLCYTCNAALGMFYDSPDNLESAINYLKERSE